MIDEQYNRLPGMYICQIPAVRVSPVSGKDLPPERTDPDTGVEYLDITTNAAAVQRAQELFISGKAQVRKSRTLKALKEVLEGIEKEFSEINFTPEEKAVRKDEFEGANMSRISEIAYLTDKDVIRLKASNRERSSDLFRVPTR